MAGCSVFGELSRVPKLTLTEAHEERKEECCKPVYFHQISSLILLTALDSGEPARYRSSAGVTVPDRHRGPEFFHVRGKSENLRCAFLKTFLGSLKLEYRRFHTWVRFQNFGSFFLKLLLF